MAGKEIADLLAAHEDCFEVLENGRIQCRLNGHCLPPNRAAIESFISGKRFQKMISARVDAQQLTRLEPFIVPSKKHSKQLFCALTGRLLDKNYTAARKHMKGARFVRARERFMTDRQDLLEEQDEDKKPFAEAAGEEEPAEEVDPFLAEMEALAARDDAEEDEDGGEEVDPMLAEMETLAAQDGAEAGAVASAMGVGSSDVDRSHPPANGMAVDTSESSKQRGSMADAGCSGRSGGAGGINSRRKVKIDAAGHGKPRHSLNDPAGEKQARAKTRKPGVKHRAKKARMICD